MAIRVQYGTICNAISKHYTASITSTTFNVYSALNCTYLSLTTNILNVSTLTTGSLIIGQQFFIGSNLNTISTFGTGKGGTGIYYLSSYVAVNTVVQNFIAFPNTIIQNLFVDVNFGKSYIYEQNNSMSSKIGICYPIIAQQYDTLFSYHYSSN